MAGREHDVGRVLCTADVEMRVRSEIGRAILVQGRDPADLEADATRGRQVESVAGSGGSTEERAHRSRDDECLERVVRQAVRGLSGDVEDHVERVRM